MPIYAFECTNCGHTFDRLQKMADADPTTCPVCGKETVKRADHRAVVPPVGQRLVRDRLQERRRQEEEPDGRGEQAGGIQACRSEACGVEAVGVTVGGGLMLRHVA